MTNKINPHISDINGFISDLEEFENLSGANLKSKIKSVKNKWNTYRQEFRKITEREHQYSDIILTEKTIRILEKLTKRERVDNLKNVLSKYADILNRFQDYSLHPNILIVDTFLFEKRFTSIDVAPIKSERVAQFITDLKPFFFVSKHNREVHISRFKTLVKIAKGEMGKGIDKVNLSDVFADLSGTFYDYTPKLIVQHCYKKGLEHLLHLIKK